MKLKIGKACTKSEESYIRLAKYGYDCGDFYMADTDDAIYHSSDEEFFERLKAVKGYADKHGIKIHQMHGPWRYPVKDDSEEERAERFEKMSRSISAAPILGCKYFVVHPMMPYGISDLPLGKAEETREINLEYFKNLTEVAKKEGVIICLENMPFLDFSLSTPEKIVELVREINDENFMCCLDTGHVACFKELSLGDAVRTMGEYLKVLHVHDNHGRDTHELPYLGKIDWNDFYKGLCDIDFDGVLNFETDVPYKKLDAETADLMERALVRIAKQILHEI